jgi:hypothetical protein
MPKSGPPSRRPTSACQHCGKPIDLLGVLTSSVARVATEKAAHDEARADSTAAGGELLELLVDTVEPALSALVARIPVANEVRFYADTGRSAESPSWAQLNGVDLHGVHVAGHSSPVEDLPRAKSGRYRGRGLWLLEDRRLVELSFSGTWSSEGPQGEVLRKWQAQLEELSATEAAERWRVEEIAERLATLLEKQSRQEVTKSLQARAQKLRTVVTLLR